MSDAFLGALADHFKPRPKPWETPLHAARALTPGVSMQTPALQLIDDFLMRAYNTPNFRGIISMPPQNGKSERASKMFPAWVLSQNPETRIVIASYQHQIAERITSELRTAIKNNGEAGGLVIGGKDTESEWRLRGHRGGVLAASVGGSLTSRSADLLIIDDPVKGFEEAMSETYQKRAWRWWTGTARTRVQNGGAVIVILTRWHDNDLAGQLMRANPGGWEFLRIPAQADHRPEKGETDPLGREPGEYMQSVQEFNAEEWEQVKQEVGSKTWASLYQGVPSPDGGTIFNPEHFKTTARQLFITSPSGARYLTNPTPDTELIQSWDLAFKGTTTSDWVVGQVWLRVGAEVHLIDQVRGRWGFSETQQQVLALTAKYPQAVMKLIEDKANGPAIIDSLKKKVPGIVPVTPDGGKEARAHAVNPLIEAGNVHLPEGAPWVGEFLEEAAMFPNGKHDDQVDAMTQALNRLMIRIFDKKNTGAPVALG